MSIRPQALQMWNNWPWKYGNLCSNFSKNRLWGLERHFPAILHARAKVMVLARPQTKPRYTFKTLRTVLNFSTKLLKNILSNILLPVAFLSVASCRKSNTGTANVKNANPRLKRRVAGGRHHPWRHFCGVFSKSTRRESDARGKKRRA